MTSTSPAPPFAATQPPSAAIIEAIAMHVVTVAAQRNPSRKGRESSEDRTAASRAYSAVLWSDEAQAVRDVSGGFDPADDAENALAEVNRLPASIGFEIGFAMALEIGARIALDPLAAHDVSDLLAAARVQYALDLHWYREECVLAERRFAAARSANATESVLDEFNAAIRENRIDKIAEFVGLTIAEMRRRGIADEIAEAFKRDAASHG